MEKRPEQAALPSSMSLETARKDILAEVIAVVRATNHPVPLEALADRAVRNLGYDKTVGSAWGGVGGFRDLLAKGYPRTSASATSRLTTSMTPRALPGAKRAR